MLHMKCCPKCEGDVALNKDYYGFYVTCLQCGWSKDIPKDKVSSKSSHDKHSKLALAA